MKKIYTSAYLRIVSVNSRDIIATSTTPSVGCYPNITSTTDGRVGEREDWEEEMEY